MEFLTNEQKRILDDFVEHTKNLIQYGFTYSFTHNDFNHDLECIEKKMQLIKSVQRSSPEMKNCYERMLQQEYITYIIKLVRAGLKHVKDNPEYWDEVAEVQRVLDEYGRLIRNANIQRPASAYYTELKNEYPVKQNPTKEKSNKEKSAKKIPPRKNLSSDENEVFEAIYEKINSLSRRVNVAQSKATDLGKTFTTSRSFKRSSDCLRKLDDNISRKLFEIQNAKKNRMRQREKERNFVKTMPTKNLNHYFNPVQNDEDCDYIEDSYDEIPSEVIVKNETFIKPQPAKIGRIERNIVIPIQVDENQKYPTIKPYAYFEKGNDGLMRISVHLEFDEKVLCNDKLVNQINVRNLLTM